MKRYLDSLSQPSDAQLRLAKQSGFDGWAGYLGGPTAAGVWSSSTFARVRQAGLAAPGFWVGLGRIADAVAAAQTLDRGSIIGHDIETGSDVANFNDSYAELWASAIRSAGYRPVLYGLPALTNRFGNHYDGVWFAGGPYYRSGNNPPPSDPRESGYAQSVKKLGWQWYGTHDFSGIGVDESVLDDWFGGDIMDWNTVVKSWYLLAFKRNPAQSEVDGWASRLRAGENGEAILDEFFAGPEGIAFLHPSGTGTDMTGLATSVTTLKAEVTQIKQGLALASQ